MSGVLDLKGRISYKNNKLRKTRQVTLMVESKEYPVIRRLSELTGTKPEVRAAKPLSGFIRRGCTVHCPEAHVHVSDVELSMPRIARWTVTGAAMVVVLDNLKGYLQVDRGYPEAIAEVLAMPTLQGQGAAAVLGAVNRLQSLGWAIPEPYAGALARLVESRLEASDDDAA
jgi:hypothetical protein